MGTSGAREEGRVEGEQLGLEKGKLAGKVQMLEELLEIPHTPDTELQSLAAGTLNADSRR